MYRLVADGYSPQWWFNVRPSNNEPLLRGNFESQDAAQLAPRALELIQEIRDFCKKQDAAFEVENSGYLSI